MNKIPTPDWKKPCPTCGDEGENCHHRNFLFWKTQAKKWYREATREGRAQLAEGLRRKGITAEITRLETVLKGIEEGSIAKAVRERIETLTKELNRPDPRQMTMLQEPTSPGEAYADPEKVLPREP